MTMQRECNSSNSEIKTYPHKRVVQSLTNQQFEKEIPIEKFLPANGVFSGAALQAIRSHAFGPEHLWDQHTFRGEIKGARQELWFSTFPFLRIIAMSHGD